MLSITNEVQVTVRDIPGTLADIHQSGFLAGAIVTAASVNFTIANARILKPHVALPKDVTGVCFAHIPLPEIAITDGTTTLQILDGYTEHRLLWIANWLPRFLSYRWRRHCPGVTTYRYLPVSDFEFGE